MSRPTVVLAVMGTGTEVGKTWVGARLLEQLCLAGWTVIARKPVQSYDPADGEATDAEVLAAASGQRPHDVCPPHRSLAVPMAPPMAADVLGSPSPAIGDLLEELVWPERSVDLGLIETVGGVRSPMADDGDSRDFVRCVEPDAVLLVADAGLGTIDAVRLAVGALAGQRVILHLNRFRPDDDLHRRNRDWLRDRDGLEPVTAVEEVRVLLSGWWRPAA